MKRIFTDTNVLIDLLANRKPFSLEAAQLFDAAVKGKVIIHISAVSYNNIWYILRPSLGHAATMRLLDELAEMTEVADVTGPVIHNALRSGSRDFEDAIQYHCALSVSGVDCIVTRDAKGFKGSSIAVLSPGEAVSLLSDI